MTLTAIAMTNFISLNQLADKLDRTVEQVEADIEDYGIPLYRNNGSYGLTVEDTESYINNLLAVKAKQILETIYLDNAIKPAAVQTLSSQSSATSAFPSVYSFVVRRKTDTKECVRDTLKNLGNYDYYLQSLVIGDPGSQEFINALATELKHHKSKSTDSKVKEINKAILELWAEIKA